MMQADQTLTTLFAEDLPPARDVVFQESVLHALDRRMFWQDISVLVATCVSGLVLIWLLRPSLEPLVVGLGQLATPGLSILVIGALLVGQGLRFPRTLGL